MSTPSTVTAEVAGSAVAKGTTTVEPDRMRGGVTAARREGGPQFVTLVGRVLLEALLLGNRAGDEIARHEHVVVGGVVVGRVRLRRQGGPDVPERQVHVAGSHQVLRRLHGREGEEGHRRPEQGRRQPEAVHGHVRRHPRKATGLPKLAVRNDLLGHVLELKGQLDDYAAGKYTKAATEYHAAYNHMFMTGDLVAGAIAKQKGLK